MNHSPLTLEAIIVLDAIASRGSFAAAADQLGKVPSALSYIVQKLEQQLSVTIFVRQGRRSVLTPAGKHLLSEGRKVLAAVSKITEQTQTLAHGWEPKIRIAFDSIIDSGPLMLLLQRFLVDFPNVEIDLSEHVMHGAWEALLEDKVDLLIAGSAPIPVQSGIRAEKLMTVEMILVAAASHELAATKQMLTRDDIADYRTVVVHDSATNVVGWSSNLISQSRHFYVASVAQKIAAIEANIGIGFLPRERVVEQLKSGTLVQLNLNEAPSHDALFLAWKTVNKGKGLAELRNVLQAGY